MASMTVSQMAMRQCSFVSRTAGSAPRRVLACTVRAEASRNPVEAAKQVWRNVELPAVARPAAVAAVANAIMAMPAHAEAGKIFDFNLTMPVMATQFLLLMVFLDKTWFTPVGKVLDDRDAYLRNKLASVRDNSSELKKLQDQAQKVVQDARAEATKLLADTKAEVNAEIAEALNKVKKDIDRELEVALAALTAEEEEALKNLDSQVSKLTDEILGRILPEGVKL